MPENAEHKIPDKVVASSTYEFVLRADVPVSAAVDIEAENVFDAFKKLHENPEFWEELGEPEYECMHTRRVVGVREQANDAVRYHTMCDIEFSGDDGGEIYPFETILNNLNEYVSNKLTSSKAVRTPPFTEQRKVTDVSHGYLLTMRFGDEISADGPFKSEHDAYTQACEHFWAAYKDQLCARFMKPNSLYAAGEIIDSENLPVEFNVNGVAMNASTLQWFLAHPA